MINREHFKHWINEILWMKLLLDLSLHAYTTERWPFCTVIPLGINTNEDWWVPQLTQTQLCFQCILYTSRLWLVHLWRRRLCTCKLEPRSPAISAWMKPPALTLANPGAKKPPRKEGRKEGEGKGGVLIGQLKAADMQQNGGNTSCDIQFAAKPPIRKTVSSRSSTVSKSGFPALPWHPPTSKSSSRGK